MKRRKFIKIGCTCLLISNFLSLNFAHSKTQKKIINKSLSEAQKNIMFNEGTERRFSSPLNYEKRNFTTKEKNSPGWRHDAKQPGQTVPKWGGTTSSKIEIENWEW